jgi:hypothetical protein
MIVGWALLTIAVVLLLFVAPALFIWLLWTQKEGPSEN